MMHGNDMRQSTRHTATVLLFATLSACGTKQPTSATMNSLAVSSAIDPVTDTTTEAMCADPAGRAHAIGRIAGDPKFSSDPDAVYEVASDIAKKGCPKPKG